MKIEFMEVVRDHQKSKTGRLLKMLQEGQRGNMAYFAKKLGTTNDVVRGLICLLRKKGHPIFNRTIEGTSNQTQYFLAKPGMTHKVINKVHYTMSVPKGHHILKTT